jgi:hypothetical protein
MYSSNFKCVLVVFVLGCLMAVGVALASDAVSYCSSYCCEPPIMRPLEWDDIDAA